MRKLKVLFWITIFLNSFLLFFIEPIFNRMLLPVAGGSMSVWNIALMCFQIILLGGYFYTHFLPKLVGTKTYTKIHIGLLLFSAIIAFAYFRPKEFAINTSSPWIDIILILLSTIGVPFFVTSTSSTNFQRWYSLTLKERPYYLYSLSNTGNLLALIGYGLVVERIFGLKNQIVLWNFLYAFTVIIGIYIGLRVLSVYKKMVCNILMNIPAILLLMKLS